MVIAYHLIMTLYGWWLPNDPRGSTSRAIRNDVLGDLGELHYGRKRIQPASADIRAFYARAAATLLHPLLEFSEQDREVIASAFAETIKMNRYTCYACAIMHDHAHLCTRKHRDSAEEMIARLQDVSGLRLKERNLRTADHRVWGGPGWKVFLDSTDDIRRTISYIEQNPIKAGWEKQSFPFVQVYNNWPYHKR